MLKMKKLNNPIKLDDNFLNQSNMQNYENKITNKEQNKNKEQNEESINTMQNINPITRGFLICSYRNIINNLNFNLYDLTIKLQNKDLTRVQRKKIKDNINKLLGDIRENEQKIKDIEEEPRSSRIRAGQAKSFKDQKK